MASICLSSNVRLNTFLLFLVFLLLFTACYRLPAAKPGKGLSIEGRDALEAFYSSQRNIPGKQEHIFLPNLEVPKEPEVLKQVHHFTKVDRAFVEQGLERLKDYGTMIRYHLISGGLPLDLVHLAFVESAFKYKAKSGAGAAGLWQFMPATARAYGLRVGLFWDDRYDPKKSTKAAVAHLGDLYRDFGDWYLAMAAYNAGPGKVRRSMKATGSKNFFTIARSGQLRRETNEYVPKILALTHITRNLRAYGFYPDWGEQVR